MSPPRGPGVSMSDDADSTRPRPRRKAPPVSGEARGSALYRINPGSAALRARRLVEMQDLPGLRGVRGPSLDTDQVGIAPEEPHDALGTRPPAQGGEERLHGCRGVNRPD